MTAFLSMVRMKDRKKTKSDLLFNQSINLDITQHTISTMTKGAYLEDAFGFLLYYLVHMAYNI